MIYEGKVDYLLVDVENTMAHPKQQGQKHCILIVYLYVYLLAANSPQFSLIPRPIEAELYQCLLTMVANSGSAIGMRNKTKHKTGSDPHQTTKDMRRIRALVW